VIDWIAYGVAKRLRPDGVAFGSGNIAGVIAPESANNAKEGGYLIPTLALGLPGSVTMTVLLGAFTVHGLVPGPSMLEAHLSITYSMVIFLMLANILGAGACLIISRKLAALTTVPAWHIVPVALVLVTVGALQTNTRIEDIIVLCLAGTLGFIFKAGGWSRAAFSLGFVLGPTIERYFFLSYQLYGDEMFLRPSLVVAGVAIVCIALMFGLRSRSRRDADRITRETSIGDLVAFALLGVAGLAALISLQNHQQMAQIFPQFTAISLVIFCGLGLANYLFAISRSQKVPGWRHLVFGNTSDLALPICLSIGLCLGLTAAIFFAGLTIAVFVFVFSVISIADRRLTWKALMISAGLTGFVYVLFESIVVIDWPVGFIWSI
jgi:putative tricarboxylic transport membrane protein